MTDETFTDPAAETDDWVDVRMSDPDEGEWDIDVIVAGGQVEYVDLRIRPELLGTFTECLLDDVGDDQTRSILTRLADAEDVGVADRTDEQ